MFKIKITPLFIFLIILEIVLFIVAFYYLAINNEGGMALAGAIALIASIINLALVLLEQVIAGIKGINKKVLWIVEIAVIIIGLIYVMVNGFSIG